MMKKWGFAIVALGLLFTACNNDDDGVEELPIEEQNQVDDDAIVQYLHDHYFDSERGLIKEFDADDESDDEYPTLHSQGTKLPSGVWIIKRAGVVAEGPIADENTKDSILISLQTQAFIASNKDLAENEKLYSGIAPLNNLPWTTINSSGVPIWDPSYYFINVPKLNLNDNVNLTHFEIEGFTEGLKHFNSTNNDGTDLYNFQGAIIVPSRLAFGRDFAYVGNALNYTYRNYSFIFNFELHKVIDRIP